MKFFRDGGGRLEFSDNAWATLMEHRQMGPGDPEAGGILLGRLILNTQDIVIDEVTSPGVRDHRSRFTFSRSRPKAQKVVNQVWKDSAGTSVYLGEWHSHPQDDPVPSAVDRKDRTKILKHAVTEQGFLFFVIVGKERIRVWEGTQETGETRELESCVPLNIV